MSALSELYEQIALCKQCEMKTGQFMCYNPGHFICSQHDSVIVIDEITGKKEVTVNVGSCFKEKTVKNKPIIEGVPYISLDLPGIDVMANWWQQGIDKARPGLWKALGDWFAQSARTQSRLFEQSAKTVHEQVKVLLDQRLHQTQSDYMRRLKELEELERLCQQIQKDADRLYETGISSSSGR